MSAGHPESTNGTRSRVSEYLGIAALAVSAVVALAGSWRRWPDPIIDAGHQLYTAWRLSEGAVLYRDVGSLYGPLSSYWNALLFRSFGPGMMVLVWANLIVYLAITVLAYRLFRAAYGIGAALAAMAVFIWVFSFNQLIPVGNCTYALPYAHESTHGVLLSLGLISVAHRWIENPGARRSFVLGLLGGLAIVLKPEFMLLGAFVVGCAVLLRLRAQRPITAVETALAGVALVIPMALFTLHFWRSLPLAAAFRSANQAWWSVLVSHVHAHVWTTFLGVDAPIRNLGRLALAGGILMLSVGTMWLGAHRASRGSRLAILLVPIPCALALADADWLKAAFGVPLGLLAVLAVRIAKAMRGRDAESSLRLLLAAGAFALFVRMILYPRFFHFGFYQAALATMVVVAEILVLLGSAAGRHNMARLVVHASTGLVIASACLGIFLSSRTVLSLRTFPVGAGRDQFLTFAPQQDASGFLVEKMVDALRLQPDSSRVLVVPEGLMINYLARRKSPVPEWIFIDLTLAGSAEAALVDRLRADPPERVVLISRDLREHGITHFGAAGQPGGRLLAFFHQHYRLMLQLGGDPFAPHLQGAMLLGRAR